MWNRAQILAAFHQAIQESEGLRAERPLRPRAVALRAYQLFEAALKSGEKLPSRETFRKLAAGPRALPEISALLQGAGVFTWVRTRRDQPRMRSAFEKAAKSLAAELKHGRARPRDVARRAREVYAREGGDGVSVPTVFTFERLLYGKSADPEIAVVIGTHSKGPDREKILAAFREAVRLIAAEGNGKPPSPRAVALRAHAVYGATLAPEERCVSAESFRKLASGRRILPEIAALFAVAGIRALPRASVDRGRLRAVFEEAIRRLEGRILKGRARPLQIARRAYEIYSREEVSPPSPSTFQRMVYGKVADPEIRGLIDSALKGKVRG
jgi:hypothetical protein